MHVRWTDGRASACTATSETPHLELHPGVRRPPASERTLWGEGVRSSRSVASTTEERWAAMPAQRPAAIYVCVLFDRRWNGGRGTGVHGGLDGWTKNNTTPALLVRQSHSSYTGCLAGRHRPITAPKAQRPHPSPGRLDIQPIPGAAGRRRRPYRRRRRHHCRSRSRWPHPRSPWRSWCCDRRLPSSVEAPPSYVLLLLPIELMALVWRACTYDSACCRCRPRRRVVRPWSLPPMSQPRDWLPTPSCMPPPTVEPRQSAASRAIVGAQPPGLYNWVDVGRSMVSSTVGLWASLARPIRPQMFQIPPAPVDQIPRRLTLSSIHIDRSPC